MEGGEGRHPVVPRNQVSKPAAAAMVPAPLCILHRGVQPTTTAGLLFLYRGVLHDIAQPYGIAEVDAGSAHGGRHA